MTKLDEDLKALKDEAFTKKDIIPAAKLIAEISGAAGVFIIAANLLSYLFGPAGILVQTATINGYLYVLMKAYADLPADQRCLIRKLTRAIRGIF